MLLFPNSLVIDSLLPRKDVQEFVMFIDNQKKIKNFKPYSGKSKMESAKMGLSSNLH